MLRTGAEAGRLKLEDLPILPAAGAPLVVIGAPLVIASEAFCPSESDAERLARVIGDMVRAVKGTDRRANA
jgi:hypothetical protein